MKRMLQKIAPFLLLAEAMELQNNQIPEPESITHQSPRKYRKPKSKNRTLDKRRKTRRRMQKFSRIQNRKHNKAA